MIQKIWDVNPSIGGPIFRNKVWFNYTFRHLGSTKTKTDAYVDKNPSQFIYDPDFTKPGVDDGHIVSNAGRISWQVSSKDKISVYHDNQRKYRNHWGIAATIPPEAAGVQVTPTSFVNVTKWTRTHTNKLLLEAGFGMYNQEYTELYQPSVAGHDDKVWDDEAIRNSRVYNVLDSSNNRQANAWPNPADHFSVLRTFMGAASYVAGSHSFRGGMKLDQRRLEAADDVDRRHAADHLQRRPPGVGDAAPAVDRNNGVDRDLGLFLQDRWSLGRITLNLGLRYDQFIGESRESSVLPSRHGAGATFGDCPDGTVDPGDLCTGEVQNWKDISPRVGFAMDVFGNGRTAIKASYARYVAGQAIAFANQVNPIGALTAADTRAWTDLDGNGLPLDANGNIQFNELAPSASTPTFGRLTVPTTQYSPDLLRGWGKRGYNDEITFAMQHQLADRISVNGGYYRRTFGNATFTDDLRYDANSYDSFCITAPSDPDLPDGGGYQVCGVQDLKPAVFAQNLPANSLIRFSEDFGGETNMYQGFDVNLEARFRNGAFLKAGIGATARTFDNCNLLAAGLDAVNTARQLHGHRNLSGRQPRVPSRIPYPPRREDVGFVHAAVGRSARRHVPVHPRHPDRRRRPEPDGELGGDERRGAAADRPHLDGRGLAHRRLDSRRSGLRQAQPQPARPQAGQALHRRQGPPARRLRPLQRVQQQLAVHGEQHVLERDDVDTGSGRRTCCSTASSSWAGTSASKVTELDSSEFRSKQNGHNSVMGRMWPFCFSFCHSSFVHSSFPHPTPSTPRTSSPRSPSTPRARGSDSHRHRQRA